MTLDEYVRQELQRSYAVGEQFTFEDLFSRIESGLRERNPRNRRLPQTLRLVLHRLAGTGVVQLQENVFTYWGSAADQRAEAEQPTGPERGATEIPAYVIEYFLLGRTRRDAIQRYTQDSGILSDVWLAFARDQTRPQRVLVAPARGTTAIGLAYALHHAIAAYRSKGPEGAGRQTPRVSPLEHFVAVTVYFDELLRVILPATDWWRKKDLNTLRRGDEVAVGRTVNSILEEAILTRLGRSGEVELRREVRPSTEAPAGRGVIEAAPLAALIGVFGVARLEPSAIEELQGLDPRAPAFGSAFESWIDRHAQAIATRARSELAESVGPWLSSLRATAAEGEQPRGQPVGAPPMIQRVFRDREPTLADIEANRTVKADAATRLFELSCQGITWALLDAGIAATHPAFLDHGPCEPGVERPNRIESAFDFTLIDRIRNLDLIAFPDGSEERDRAIDGVIEDLERLPGRTESRQFRALARRNLRTIARQLDLALPPDWSLIEPLISVGNQDDGAQLVSDHGTHVAGILAADWRTTGPDGREKILLQGICPDLRLVDLRVIHPDSRQSTEFAVLAALEYVQYANARAGANGPVIHGVNVSLSIPHDVRNYGCGATPVCVACDRLVNSGVVVVAAAGNRGWNELEAGFGNFVFSSITDPGNARDVITVGSTHRIKPHTYGVSYFSSRGPTGDGRVKPDLVAPGEQIQGPIRGDADDDLGGTSMAAPFVSGAAAMLLSRHRELIGDPARIKEILCSTATDLGRERYFQGHGMLDVLRALQSV